MHRLLARHSVAQCAVVALVLAAAISLLVALASAAGDRVAIPANATWRTECAACHLAYPPGLLPAGSWRAIMTGLERHFGANASLEPAVSAEIASFLERNAGPDRGGATPLRITETRWFLREHRGVPKAVWARPAIKSPANCSACHRAAERGDFDDDTVVVPR